MTWTPAGEPRGVALPPDVTAAASVRVALVPIRQGRPDGVAPDLTGAALVDPAEATTFRTAKRAEDHATGRTALAHVLTGPPWHLHAGALHIVRSDHRRPSLAMASDEEWRGPEVSIAHAGRWAAAAAAAPGTAMGLDLEPVGRERRPAVIDFMTRGDEAQRLHAIWGADAAAGRIAALRSWTGREAVQKATGLGMALAPQRIDLRPLLGAEPRPDGSLHIVVPSISPELPALQLWSWTMEAGDDLLVLALALDAA